MSSSTTLSIPRIEGLWLLDRNGQTVLIEGCLRNAEWQAALAARVDDWALRGELPSVLAVHVLRQALALCMCLNDRLLILAKPTGSIDPLHDFLLSVPFAPAVLNHFLTSPHDAITVADDRGILRYICPKHEKWLGLRRGEALGRPANQIIPNSRLAEVAQTGKAEIGQPYTADGIATRIVSRIPIFENQRVVGVIGRTLFKGPEAVQRMYKEVSKLQAEVARYRRDLGQLRMQHEALAPLLGQSAPIRALKQDLLAVAQLDIPVLIVGDSGTGKELVAKALHALSPRATNALVTMNLAALPANLLESELFGYAPGSFTGSLRSGRLGKFELAERSTFFLDEVGDIPPEIQVKLLRVLEDHVVERLGENKPRNVDFRLICATHRKLDDMVQAGQFRLDLYYRIAGVTLQVPSLSERLEDIPELVDEFVRRFCERNRWAVPALDSDVLTYLARQSWPGNVRQLRQKVEEALVFSAGKTLAVSHFERRGRAAAQVGGSAGTVQVPERILPLAELERRAARDAVRLSDGNKRQAAVALGISRSHLYKLLAAAAQARDP